MRDKDLETKLRLVSLQLDNWKKLHDLITYGLDKAKPIISTEQERQFTDIRGNLLQETEYVLRQLNILAEASGKAIETLLRNAVAAAPAAGGKVKGFKPHAVAFLGYLISHESHHRGQIGWTLKQSGHPLDQKTSYGLWEWGVR